MPARASPNTRGEFNLLSGLNRLARGGRFSLAKKKGYSAGDLREVSGNPEWTKKDFAKARPFAEALPDLAESIRKGRGPNKAPRNEDLRRINKIK
jgi:hypothetical protein